MNRGRGLHNSRFMSQARRTRHFARSGRRGRRKNFFFSSPHLAIRAFLALGVKCRFRLASLIKRLLCRLQRTSSFLIENDFKKFFKTAPPPLSLCLWVWMTARPLSEGLDPPLLENTHFVPQEYILF